MNFKKAWLYSVAKLAIDLKIINYPFFFKYQQIRISII